MKTLLVGEANPYGADPEYALYPLPERASGDRLCRLVMGLERRDYLERFDRVNLCPQKWSTPLARERATELAQRGGKFVLLGSKVTRAFGFDYNPFDHFKQPEQHGGRTYVLLPHPSGLCRLWNEPGAFERAREALRAAGVL